MLREGSVEGKLNAAKALAYLMIYNDDNKAAVVAAGAIPPLDAA
jgi:hypothetical protein